MNKQLSTKEVVNQNTRTMFLIKDLFENCYPKDTEDLPNYWQGVSMFIAHTKDWNSGVEELGRNLLCRKGEISEIHELPEYTGPITRDGVIDALNLVAKPVIRKQQLGLIPKRNFHALSDHILKQYDISSGLRKKISLHLFSLAADIKGSEHQY